MRFERFFVSPESKPKKYAKRVFVVGSLGVASFFGSVASADAAVYGVDILQLHTLADGNVGDTGNATASSYCERSDGTVSAVSFSLDAKSRIVGSAFTVYAARQDGQLVFSHIEKGANSNCDGEGVVREMYPPAPIEENPPTEEWGDEEGNHDGGVSIEPF